MFIKHTPMDISMEFDELLITTGVDALVRLVKEKKRIELDIASQLLNIPRGTLEEWSRVLEEEGILKIDYHLTKIFLLWVEPTAEELAAERKNFYEEKKGLEVEIKVMREKVAPEMENLKEMKKSFAEIYEKIYPKLTEMEERLTIPSVSPPSYYTESLEKLKSRLAAVESATDSINKELEKIRKKVTAPPKTEPLALGRFEGLKNELNRILNRLTTVNKKLEESLGVMPRELPPTVEIKKKFEYLKKEFNDVRTTVARLRSDLGDLKDASELLTSIGSELKGYKADIAASKKEINGLLKSVENIRSKSATLMENLKKDIDTLERFSDSVDVAADVMKKFPSQHAILTELKKLSEREKSLQESIKAMEGLLSSLKRPHELVSQFNELKNEIEAKRREVETETAKLESAIKDDRTAYLTFQKIKERIIESIDAYRNEVKKLHSEISSLSKETGMIETKMAAELDKYRKRMEQKDIREMLKLGQELKEKKELLDKIAASINSLSTAAENMNKRLTLLSKEAALLELRAPGELPQKEEGLRQQLKLTKDEEEDFRKKREELRNLIRKLWEQG